MRAVAAPARRGRWVWGLSGLLTAAVLAVPGLRLIVSPGHGFLGANPGPPPDTVVRTVTVPQQITSLDVQTYGGPARVTTGHVRQVQVTEVIGYDKRNGGPPAMTQSVSGGRLTLADPVCNTADCAVGYTVTVPAAIPVTMATGGGPAAVSGAPRR